MSSSIFKNPAPTLIAEAATPAGHALSGKEEKPEGGGQSITPPPPSKIAKDGVTPMMTQFLGIKADHQDSLLFYRMGDFYELFFEDAVKAAAALDIALTKRGKHLGEDIPMCGVPAHSHEAYLNRLIRHGFRVAICEQTEEPAEAKKRGAKAVVRRDVVRVVTPGTLTEDTLLDARRHNYLAAIVQVQKAFGLAWIDVSTGALMTQTLEASDLDAALARIDPGELLVAETMLEKIAFEGLAEDWVDRLTPLPATRLGSTSGRKRLEALYGVAALDAFGDFNRAEIAAAGGVVDYVALTQKGKLPRIAPPVRFRTGAIMEIDASTRRNLELTRTLSGEFQGSLLSVIDRTVTGAGARTLGRQLAQPLTDPDAIAKRLDAVQFFVDDGRVRSDARDVLGAAPDVARALSRLTIGRGGPRDLAAIRDGLTAAMALATKIDESPAVALPENIADARADLGGHEALIARLSGALADELPLLARDGGSIRAGYNANFDELVALRDESRKLIAHLQALYAEDTGRAGLKIKHNNVLGYFIELPAKQAEGLATGEDSPYIHRQTMANAMRFTTLELSELEGRILKAADRALALELSLINDLVTQVTAEAEPVALAAEALAGVDVMAALGELAVTRRYVRPSVDASYAFAIKDGRHPVVEAALERGGTGPFVANDCHLDPANEIEGAGRLWLLTGPNMAGKSTFLRQNALIAVMAQAGSFVPAAAARIGVVDRLFSRVGASDDLAQGRSTFMVEMVETATILNQAGVRSLVILDEIGRGTATYDGLAIAWAVVEHLHEESRCRALFATHYHELTALSGRLDHLRCHTMRVKEWRDDVVFLHEVAAGAADRSYGIHVGKLAGLPAGVVDRAEAILKTLEADEQGSAMRDLAVELPLFENLVTASAAAAPTGPTPVERAVDRIIPDEMTPRAALDFVYELRRLLDDKADEHS